MAIRRFFLRSSLFYRNQVIAWSVTVLVYLLYVLSQAHKGFLVLLLPAVYLAATIWSICLSIHPRRHYIFRRYNPDHFGLKAEQITFYSKDGTRLSSWYIPGSSCQAIILVHGLGSAGLAMAKHARMFAAAGYHVLLPDLRAHGNSEGDTITDISGADDILAAVDYLRTRSDGDVEGVAALGISFGALAVLHAARQTDAIRAIVLESIGPAALADHGGKPQTLRRWITYPFNWLQYKIFDFMCGFEENKGVIESLRCIYPRPVMFISTGVSKERYFMRLFYKAARQPKSIWEVPRASHGIALTVRSKEYRERLLKFFGSPV